MRRRVRVRVSFACRPRDTMHLHTHQQQQHLNHCGHHHGSPRGWLAPRPAAHRRTACATSPESAAARPSDPQQPAPGDALTPRPPVTARRHALLALAGSSLILAPPAVLAQEQGQGSSQPADPPAPSTSGVAGAQQQAPAAPPAADAPRAPAAPPSARPSPAPPRRPLGRVPKVQLRAAAPPQPQGGRRSRGRQQQPPPPAGGDATLAAGVAAALAKERVEVSRIIRGCFQLDGAHK